MACSCGQHKTESGCRGAAFFKAQPRTYHQASGRLGGNAQAGKWHARLVSRFAHLRRAEAIAAAWSLGVHTRKLREARKRKAEAMS